jgi:hypothetical protein
VSEMTHKPKSVFAVEAETSDADLRRNLAAYRLLTANQRSAYAAELKKTVEIEEQKRSSRPQRRSRSRIKSALIVFIKSLFKSCRGELNRQSDPMVNG